MSLALVAKLEFEMMCADVPARIGLCYQKRGGPTPGYLANDLVVKAAATLLPLLQAVLSTETIVMRIIARMLTPTDGIPFEGNYTEAFAGTVASQALPPSIALLLKLRVNSDSSRNNGHIYVPGVPESKWINGAWDATYLSTPVAALCAALQATLPDSDGHEWFPVVVSRFLANVKRVPPVIFDVTTCQPSVRISQQRRRQSGQQGIKG